MDSVSEENTSSHQKLDHNNINVIDHCENQFFNKNKRDENEQKLIDFISNKEKLKIKSYFEDYNEVCDFLSSKYKAMEKMNLDDEFLIENNTETKNSDVNKNKKTNFTQKKIKSKKNSSRKKSKSKDSDKNMIIDSTGKVIKPSMKSINSVDIINFNNDKKIKEKELCRFFSNSTLLDSIVREMNNK